MSSQGDPLGMDILAIDDMEPTCRLVWGFANLQAASMRRLSSKGGCLISIGGDPDYGLDLPGEANDEGSAAQLAGINSLAAHELEKDPRFHTAETQIVLTAEDS
jgi:hypothetical protein